MRVIREGLRTKVPTAAAATAGIKHHHLHHNCCCYRRDASDGERFLRRGRCHSMLPQVLRGKHGWSRSVVGRWIGRSRCNRRQPENAPVWRQGHHLLRTGSRRKTSATAIAVRVGHKELVFFRRFQPSLSTSICVRWCVGFVRKTLDALRFKDDRNGHRKSARRGVGVWDREST